MIGVMHIPADVQVVMVLGAIAVVLLAIGSGARR